MLQDIFCPSKINYAMWSISVEWRIYFLFPLLVYAFVKIGPIRSALLTFIGALLMVFALQHTILIGIIPAYFALFAFGMLACEVAHGKSEAMIALREKMPWNVIVLPFALALLILLYTLRLDNSAMKVFTVSIFDGIVASMLLVILSQPGRNTLRDMLSWRPLTFLGTFAYSIYLIHAPILQVIWQYGVMPLHLPQTLSYGTLVACGLPLILLCSYIFFLAFERPFLTRHKNETRSEITRDAALAPAP